MVISPIREVSNRMNEALDNLISIAMLLLLVINLGVAVGAGFYEMRVVVPVWASALPRSLLSPESGLSFWMYVTTGPLTLLTLGNAVAAWETESAARTWWLIAVIIVALERIATVAYFVPTMLAMQRDQSAPSEFVNAKFARWAALNYARNAASLVAWLFALKALVMLEH
jgi:hypothetical protein